MTVYRKLSLLALTFVLSTTLLSAQNIQVGYVVVTPTDGTPDGLLAFGSLTLTAGTQASKGIFSAGPLVNAASVPISTDSAQTQDTGIAIVNPNASPTNIVLVVRFASSSVTPLTKTFTLAAGQQTSKFVTETFGSQVLTQGVPSVMTMVADMPVGVVGFNFNGTNFSAVPVTDLTQVLGPSALASLNSDITVTVTPNTTPVGTGLTTVTIAGQNVQVSATTPTTQFFPRISTTVGGNGAIVLTQYATDGGWNTQVLVENPSSSPRTIRIDFFDQAGSPLNVNFQSGSGTSFTNITIPAFGTFALTPNT
jgi:hypothetical protein